MNKHLTPRCKCGKELLAGREAKFNARIDGEQVCPDCFIENTIEKFKENLCQT